jgi:FkbM family methyltransferase
LNLSVFSRFFIRALKARYRDQKVELREIKRHVRPSDTVCDVGANKGAYLYWLSRWCSGGRVIAFEPQPALARYLTDLAKRFPDYFQNVEIEGSAVYSHSGRQNLHVPWDGAPGASLNGDVAWPGTIHSVPSVALDDVLSETVNRISLLKIDVEGVELDVFKGAKRILTEHSPLLVFECETRHLRSGTVEDVLNYLKGFGYNGSFVSGDRLIPISQFDSSIHQKHRHGDFWNRPDYCNNFILSKSAQ